MAVLAPPPALPGASWVSGYMGAYRRDALGLLEACAQQGDAVRMRFGLSQLVVLSHPGLIEQVLVAKQHAFRKGAGTRRLRSLLGAGLLTSDGDVWRRQRRLAQPAFHRPRVTAFSDVMVDYTRRMLDGWRYGETRDIHLDMMELTLQIACKTLFDADVSADLTVVRDATAVVGSHFQSRLTSLLFLLPDGFPTPGNLRYQAAVRALDHLVYRFISERRRDQNDRGDLLSMLLQAHDAEAPETRLNDREVRDEVMTFLLAGHETTALALAWACYALDQHPQAAEQLRDELERELGGRPPGLQDLPRLRYLNAVVSETLRLYPPAYVIGRQPLEDVDIGGYPIPRTASLLMSPWVVQRDRRWFADPQAFCPERWLDGRLARELPHFAYFPFGGGQRQCIGATFAQLEINLVLATLLQRVRLALEPGHPIEPLAVITLRPKYGIRMRVASA